MYSHCFDSTKPQQSATHLNIPNSSRFSARNYHIALGKTAKENVTHESDYQERTEKSITV